MAVCLADPGYHNLLASLVVPRFRLDGISEDLEFVSQNGVISTIVRSQPYSTLAHSSNAFLGVKSASFVCSCIMPHPDGALYFFILDWIPYSRCNDTNETTKPRPMRGIGLSNGFAERYLSAREIIA